MFVDFYRDLIFYLEILAAIVATITFKKYKHTPCRYFLFLLWLTVFVETLGLLRFYNYYYPEHPVMMFFRNILGESRVASNFWIYNIFIPVSYLTYFVFFYAFLKQIYKKWVLAILILYVLVVAFSVLYRINSFNEGYLSEIDIAGALFYLVCYCLYFYELLHSNEVLKLYKSLPFWILTGALIFNLTTIPIFVFSEQLNYSNHYRVVLNISNIVLYGCFITGFIINARNLKNLKITNL
ncbi:hypothetical protein OOZ15_16210 [Galbibacter sp. EGI 63066]|uniref:hypothetical protein n=1 Tax=Galbibacter sp. EGI 63066 TaxID=2993559 RepID=UPI0022495C27|nr:hypothetical protein [Galbibacter sp. EGI 63066]MCX2681498.1 hypothetical protein [Galbibacter sp. EGI 63066]